MSAAPTDNVDGMQIKPDVRAEKYIGSCPGCGRARLLLYVDGPAGDPRAVAVKCEKCALQWLLDPAAAAFHGPDDDSDPLRARPDPARRSADPPLG